MDVQKDCTICGKKLSFWFTSLKKHEGQKICTKCAMKVAKNEMVTTVQAAKSEMKEAKDSLEYNKSGVKHEGETKECLHCKTQIPKKASKCPNCGGNIYSPLMILWVAAFATSFIGLILSFFIIGIPILLLGGVLGIIAIIATVIKAIMSIVHA